VRGVRAGFSTCVVGELFAAARPPGGGGGGGGGGGAGANNGGGGGGGWGAVCGDDEYGGRAAGVGGRFAGFPCSGGVIFRGGGGLYTALHC
jgi:hypothetical protein